MDLSVSGACGSVRIRVTGEAALQYVCHCDDCQAVHGRAFACSLHPASAVSVARGETEVFTLRTSPRTRCKRCLTSLFAEVPGQPWRALNAERLPAGLLVPRFHSQCRFAVAPVDDTLPHYWGLPARFGGTDELMEW